MLQEPVETYQVIKRTEYLFFPPHEVASKSLSCGGIKFANLQFGKKVVNAKKKQPTKALVTMIPKKRSRPYTNLHSEDLPRHRVLEDDEQYASFKLEFNQQKCDKR